MKLSVMMLTPALIIERVVGNPAVMKLGPVLIAAGLGYSLVAAGITMLHSLSGAAVYITRKR